MEINFKRIVLLVFLISFFYKNEIKNTSQEHQVSRSVSSVSDDNEVADSTLVNPPESAETQALEIINQANQVADVKTHSMGSSSTQQFINNAEKSAIQSVYSHICQLPKGIVDPNYYAKYCKNTCFSAGTKCSLSSQCCSQMCSQGVCLTDQKNKLLPGSQCQSNSDCYTNNCANLPNFPDTKICLGQYGSDYCSYSGDTCVENSNCCSNYCSNNRCLGSDQAPTELGGYCKSDHSECASHYCNLATHRCE